MSIDPWTVYWQGDHLQSCIATASPDDAAAIAAFWRDFATALADGSRVLDLACGNGAVPKELIKNNNGLEICAVDKADIAPQKFLSDFAELSRVEFHGEVDICDLPFESASFDAVTSQFGLEYAVLSKACISAARVLKPQGNIRLLMHHPDSEILRPVNANLAEMARLLSNNGVMAGIESYMAREIDLQQLEAIGKQYLDSDAAKTPQLSGQIFAGVNTLIDVLSVDEARAKLLMATMKAKLLADQSRLQQLSCAALNEDRHREVQQALQSSGIAIELFEPLTITATNDSGASETVLIGWQLLGSKH